MGSASSGDIITSRNYLLYSILYENTNLIVAMKSERIVTVQQPSLFSL